MPVKHQIHLPRVREDVVPESDSTDEDPILLHELGIPSAFDLIMAAVDPFHRHEDLTAEFG